MSIDIEFEVNTLGWTIDTEGKLFTEDGHYVGSAINPRIPRGAWVKWNGGPVSNRVLTIHMPMVDVVEGRVKKHWWER